MLGKPENLIQLMVIVLAMLVLYWGVLGKLVVDWGADPNNSHGFLVPLVSLWLVRERWEQLRRLRPAPSWMGAGLIGGGILVLLAGSLGAELFLQRTSMVAVILGLIWFNLGWGAVKLLAFPVLFLLLAVPIPQIVLNVIAFPLQLFAAQAAEWSLNLLAIPVYREGNIIELSHTTLEVAEACSGIRSLVSLIALSIIFAYFAQKHIGPRLLLTVSAIPIAVIANAFRVAGTGVLAHVYGTAAAQGFYHTFSGWLVFVVAFAILLAEGGLIHLTMRLMARRRGHRER